MEELQLFGKSPLDELFEMFREMELLRLYTAYFYKFISYEEFKKEIDKIGER